MPSVLIRDVPSDDLDRIRAAASQEGESLQGYLLEALRAHAAYLRRQDALARIDDRLAGRPPVPEAEREAALGAIDFTSDERTADLGSRG